MTLVIQLPHIQAVFGIVAFYDASASFEISYQTSRIMAYFFDRFIHGGVCTSVRYKSFRCLCEQARSMQQLGPGERTIEHKIQDITPVNLTAVIAVEATEQSLDCSGTAFSIILPVGW